MVYDNQLGGADEAALQEASLRQRAAIEAAAITQQGSPGKASAVFTPQDSNLAGKSTASGSVRSICFLDLDVAFWQMNYGLSLRHNAADGNAIPHLGRTPGLGGRRWVAIACENKIIIHDLCSAEAIDVARSAATDSKAPTTLAVLILNYPSLMGVAHMPADDGGGGNINTIAAEALPMLAVGTSGGSIYLISPTSGAVFAKLTGGHKGSVTCMVALSGENPGGPDMLISGSADGSISVWDPSRSAARGPDREISPKVTITKAHEGAIHDMCLFMHHEGGHPVPPPLKLVTVGEDKRLAMWEIGSWKSLGKLQPLQKAACHSVKWAPWGSAGLNAHPSMLLATGDVPVVLGLHPVTGEVTRYISLENMIDPGQKKIPKVYSLAVHPTRPDIIAAATNTGAVLMQFDPLEKPAVVALPAAVLTLDALLAQSNPNDQETGHGRDAGPSSVVAENVNIESLPKAANPKEIGKGAAGPTFVSAINGKLWSTALKLQSIRTAPGTERPVRVEPSPPEMIAQLDHQDLRPVLSCSPSGRSLSVVWPEKRAYVVYNLAPTGTWEPIARGTGSCVVWNSTGPQYAVLTIPDIPKHEIKLEKGLFSRILSSSKGPRKEDAEDAEAAAAAETTRAAIASTTVSIFAIDESNATNLVGTQNLQTSGSYPVLLHGGALLGVVLVSQSTMDRTLRFFSWNTFLPVGESLPEPEWVSWEPECTLCALGYERCVQVCRVRPAFERFAALSVPDSQGGLWQSRQLFVVTPISILLIFADPVTEFVQLVQLASIQGGVNSKTAPPSEATPLPPEQARPAGPVVLAGVRHSYLWLADSLGRPILLSLRHPGLRLRCLAAKGELTTARTIAERGLSQAFHDDVARFLAAMSRQEGVQEALALPGLSPTGEMALCIRASLWDRAAAAFQAHALGASNRAVLTMASGLSGTPTAVANTTSIVESILLEKDLEPQSTNPAEKVEVGESADEGNEGGEQEEEEEDGDIVDWESPLKGFLPDFAHLKIEDEQEEEEDPEELLYKSVVAHDEGDLGSEKKPQQIASEPVQPGVHHSELSPSELHHVIEVVELGLRFSDQAAVSGHIAAARSALGVLIGFADYLTPELMFQLVSRIGQAQMTESARNLSVAAATARPGSPLLDPGVAASLAALAGGYDADRVSKVLENAKLAPLASVFANAWGGDVDRYRKQWELQLNGRVVQPPIL